jgi:hypothetical protein
MSSGLDVSHACELQQILHRYRDLVGFDSELVLDAYYLRKPLTGIEIDGKPLDRVIEFVALMRQLFFVEMWDCPRLPYEPSMFNGTVFVSRFKTLPTVAAQYDGLSDRYSDLAGVLFGYSLENIASYCRRVTPQQFKWDLETKTVQTRFEL